MSFLPSWHTKLINFLAGSGSNQLRIGFIGDSTTIGYGSSPIEADMKFLSYPYQLGTFLVFGQQGAINYSPDNVFGGSVKTPYPATTYPLPFVDARITTSGGWVSAGFMSLGGSMIFVTGGTLTFAPNGAFDTVDVYYVDGLGGTISVGNTEIQANGATFSVKKASIPILGSTIAFSWVKGNFEVIGWDVYKSSVSTIHLLNFGCGSSTSVDWASTANVYDPLNTLPALGLDLVICMLGINDWWVPTPIATFTSAMQTIVTTCAALYPGAFLLMTPIASSAATVVPVANQLPYVAALQAIAENSEIPLLDIYSPTPWLLAKSLGYTFDGAHRNAAGYSDLAARVYAAIGPNGS